MIDKKKMGKRSRRAGKAFELKVKSKLESKGWYLSKWNNNVDLEKGKLVTAKSHYNPFLKRVVNEGSGFPDYIAVKRITVLKFPAYRVIGVECKMNGYLDKIEKQKCEWLIKNDVFCDIMIASKKGFKKWNT